MDKSKRNTYIIAAAAFVLIIAAIYFLFIKAKGPNNLKSDEGPSIVKDIQEVELAKRPFVTLTPTSDGAQIIISIQKMAEFEMIEYELIYLADNPQQSGEKIQRGSTGTVGNTKDEKYKAEMLLGTASRGVKSPDQGIQDGKLNMHLYKDNVEYLSETDWDMMEVGPRTATIKSRDEKIEIAVPSLGKPYWVILAETIGFPEGEESLVPEKVILPIIGAFSIAPEFATPATVRISLETEADAELKTFKAERTTPWENPPATFNKQTKILESKINGFATFIPVSK